MSNSRRGRERRSVWTAKGWAGNVERISPTVAVSDDEDGILTAFDAGTTSYISLASKGIRSIPKGTFEGSSDSVRTLDLESNKLAVLEADMFKGLENVEELKLSGNIIQTIQPGAFRGMENLKALYLSKNPISDLPKGAFEGLNLTTLTIHSVPLKKIDPEVWRPLRNLRKLHMYNTDLEDIPKEFFEMLPNLQVLSMHMANLPVLENGFLQPMAALEELSVDGPSLPLAKSDLFASQSKLRFVYLFGKTTEEIFKKVRSNLADENNCKVVVQENPNIGPGYSYT